MIHELCTSILESHSKGSTQTLPVMSSTSANAKAGPSSSTMVAPATTTTTKGKGKLVEGKSEKETAKSSGEEVKNQNVFKVSIDCLDSLRAVISDCRFQLKCSYVSQNDGSFLGKFQKPKVCLPRAGPPPRLSAHL